MFRLKTILAIIMTVAIAMAGVPVYAKSGCAMAAGQHQTMKDCPNCAEKSNNQTQHNKCCGTLDCAIGCASVGLMGLPTNMNTAFLPVVHQMDSFHPSDTAVISFLPLTQERPPKHLA